MKVRLVYVSPTGAALFRWLGLWDYVIMLNHMFYSKKENEVEIHNRLRLEETWHLKTFHLQMSVLLSSLIFTRKWNPEADLIPA